MITIFTPTYNRGHLIDRLYQSLLAQTSKDFEWIVIDDGSSDNTEEYFLQIIKKDNPFEIIYKKQPNGGKHRAINNGVKIARGELFFIVDSDDYLLEDAIEKILSWSKNLEDTKKWAGVSGLRGYTQNECIGGNGNKKKFIDAKNTEREKYNLCGDKAEAYFTEILRKYPFPEFEGENFITEEVVWNAIAHDGFYIRWFNEIIYICKYLDGGLTKSGNLKNIQNPQGVLYWTKMQLKVFHNSFKKKMIAVHVYINTVKDKKSLKEIAKDIGVSCAYCRLVLCAAKIKRAFSGK